MKTIAIIVVLMYNNDMVDNYFENRDEKNLNRMREIIDELPSFASEFFLGIQSRTSALTRLNYAFDLRIFFNYLLNKKYKTLSTINEIVISDIESLTPLDLDKFQEFLSSYTINGKKFRCGENAKQRKLACLRSFFKYYYKRDKLSQNITEKIDMPKIHEKSIVVLEPNEVVKILDLAEDGVLMSKRQRIFHTITRLRDLAILTLLLGTGIRISECIGLNKIDIDFEINGFNVTRKGGNQSTLYFSSEVKKPLKEYIDWLEDQEFKESKFGKNIKNKDALFLSLQGTRLTVRAAEILVKKYSMLISPLKKITPHKLRSTYGTSLYRETNDIYVVAEVLGHKDVNTTKKHYAAMSDQTRRNAANAVKLKE